MTVLELYPPLTSEFVPEEYPSPRLRLVETAPELVEDPEPAACPVPRRRASLAVRRRRTLLVLMALLLGVLALPLGGAGGNSHAPGSALAGSAHPATYVVRPGDTLWTIAERVDPTGDPRPLVARMEAQLGTDTVVPGEEVRLP
jgi:nucleoid-associated protein YgaU